MLLTRTSTLRDFIHHTKTLYLCHRLWVESSSREPLCCIIRLELQRHMQIGGENGGGAPEMWRGWWCDLAHQFLKLAIACAHFYCNVNVYASTENWLNTPSCPIFAHHSCPGTVWHMINLIIAHTQSLVRKSGEIP